MPFFTTPKIHGFGIDLSDLSIKIINLQKNGGNFKLASFKREEIPEGLIEEGEIKKEEELIEIIKKAVEGVNGKPLKTKYCVASLPETESYIRMLQIPLMEEKEVAEAIKWELEANIPLSIEEIYYDWQLIETTGTEKQLNVLVGVLPKKTVDPYLNVLKKAGLKPCIFEIESAATARALIKNGQSAEPVAVIDVGAKRTSFFIFCGQTIFFTASIPISNKSFVETLSKSLGVTFQKALEIKIKVGLDSDHPQGHIFKALEPSLMELSEKLKNFIDFYQRNNCPPDHPEQNQIKEALLCGGGAKMQGLAEFLGSRLKINFAKPLYFLA